MTQFDVQVLTAKIHRVTFANPPVNVVGADTVAELTQLVDDLANQRVQVVIFDCSLDGYFLNHAGLNQFAQILTETAADGTATIVDLTRNLDERSVRHHHRLDQEPDQRRRRRRTPLVPGRHTHHP